MEPVRRGLYSGAIGWADPDGRGGVGDFDLNVVIRTLSPTARRDVGAFTSAAPSPRWPMPLRMGGDPAQGACRLAGAERRRIRRRHWAPCRLTPRPEHALRQFLAAQGIGPDQLVHLAVSGGMDSMALLHAAHAVHSHLSVLHVDHGLRAASAEDRVFVEHTAAALGLQVTSHRIEGLTQTAAEQGEGLEAAARAARYGWFGTQVGTGGVLLTGHHADDQRETRLLHWIRGSRADAWSGMLPWTEERGYAIGRPFLGLSRKDLKQWMVQQGHPWQEDDSNRDPAFLRNRIRLELLPLLDDLHPGWEAGMARHASIRRMVQQHRPHPRWPDRPH